MNKYIIISLSAFSIFFSGVTLHAQQSINSSWYGNNSIPINQAGSLLKPEAELNLIALKKWTGIDGAPKVVWANGYAPIPGITAAAGANIRYESVGDERSTDANVFFAKAIKLGATNFLGCAINAGVSMYKGNFAQLDANDPVFNNNVETNTATIGASVMLYNPNSYYLGFSMPRYRLNNTETTDQLNYNPKNQFFISGALLLTLSSDFKLKPAFITSFVSGTTVQAEGSAMVFMKDIVGLGLNLRSYGGAAGMAQLYVSNFGIGYSYLFNTGNNDGMGQINNTSHEIALSFRFGKAKPTL